MLSVLLPYSDSDCPFGIFKLFLLSGYIYLNSTESCKLRHRRYIDQWNKSRTDKEWLTENYRLSNTNSTHTKTGMNLLNLCFVCSIVPIVVYPYLRFLLAIAFSVLLRFTASDYRFGIFKYY